MPANSWMVQVEKRKKGGARLKFSGHFHVSLKSMFYLFLLAFVSVVPLFASLSPMMKSVISTLEVWIETFKY